MKDEICTVVQSCSYEKMGATVSIFVILVQISYMKYVPAKKLPGTCQSKCWVFCIHYVAVTAFDLSKSFTCMWQCRHYCACVFSRSRLCVSLCEAAVGSLIFPPVCLQCVRSVTPVLTSSLHSISLSGRMAYKRGLVMSPSSTREFHQEPHVKSPWYDGTYGEGVHAQARAYEACFGPWGK